MNIFPQRKIIVILKNKIISFDSILPVAMEINSQCNINFEFVIWENETYNSIVDDNIVIKEMAESIGSINNIITFYKRNNIIRRFFIMLSLTRFFFSSLLFGSYVLHFGSLDTGPLLVFSKFIRRKKIVLCESALHGRYIEELTDDALLVNTSDIRIYQLRSSKKLFNKYKQYPAPRLNAGVLIAFHQDWNWFKHEDAAHANRIVFSDARKSPAYVEYLSSNCKRFIEKDFADKLYFDNSIAIILGRFDIRYGYIQERLLSDVMNVLSEIDVNIIMKPHIYCDMNIVHSIINSIPNFGDNVHITKLHPQIFSSICSGVVFINNSFIRCELKDLGVPYVQYRGGYKEMPHKDSCLHHMCDDINDFKNVINGFLEDTLLLQNHTKCKSKKINFRGIFCNKS
jgi:hypothetical protein